MSGTIRCTHGVVMETVSENGGLVVVSASERCHVRYNQDAGRTSTFTSCSLSLPKEVYDGVLYGCNFTHVFFKDEAELKEYLKDHAERFQFIGHSSRPLKDGRYHLVF